MLQQPEEIINRNFGLYKHQLEYLEKSGDNINETLRNKIETIIQIEKINNRTKKINEFFIPTGIGIIILLFSFLMTNIILIIGTVMISIFFITFGTIGGIVNEVQTTRRRNR